MVIHLLRLTVRLGKLKNWPCFKSHAIEPAYLESGTVDEWRDSVATLAVGNSRLVFALSVAFASALAEIASEDSGGFHLSVLHPLANPLH